MTESEERDIKILSETGHTPTNEMMSSIEEVKQLSKVKEEILLESTLIDSFEFDKLVYESAASESTRGR